MNGRSPLQRGVSLIEALVAFAILAVGMLGVVGMQGTMRTNADLARQRAEAVRLGQDAVEEWRGFTTLSTSANHMAYQDITGSASRTVAGTNATYTVARRALAATATANTVNPTRRGVVVEVSWQDRAGQPQLVRLSSAVTGSEPALGASLVLSTSTDHVLLPMGRNRAIPRGAVPMGIGRSGFVPPGQTASTRVAWQFDNATAALTICTTTAVASGNLNDTGVTNDCSANIRGVLISGYVRFATTTPPTLADPMGTPVSFGLSVQYTRPPSSTSFAVGCFQDPPTSNYAVPYYCAVVVTTSEPAWTGRLEFGVPPPGAPAPTLALAPTLATATNGLHKVCRYQNVPYVGVSAAKANQNFAIILAGDGATPTPAPFNCLPGGTPSTWPHQPNT